MKKTLMAFLVGFAFTHSSLVAIPPPLGESVSEINQILTSAEFQEASDNTEFVVRVIGDKHRDASTYYEGSSLHYRVITVKLNRNNVQKNFTYDITYNLNSQVGPSVVEITKIVRHPKKK